MNTEFGMYNVRDYLQESKDIIAGKTMMIAEKRHLEALNNVILDLVEGLKKLEITLGKLNENKI